MRSGNLQSRMNQLRASIAGVGVAVLSCAVPCMKLQVCCEHRRGFTHGVFAFKSSCGEQKVRRSNYPGGGVQRKGGLLSALLLRYGGMRHRSMALASAICMCFRFLISTAVRLVIPIRSGIHHPFTATSNHGASGQRGLQGSFGCESPECARGEL